MQKKYFSGLLLLFLFSFLFTAGAQTVPLGDAAKFALLAGGDIRANTAVQALDYAGAGQSVDTMVTAQNMYLRGETDQALSHLAEAMAYCNNLEGKELNREIVDIELEESVYRVGGSAVLGGRLVLHGNARSVFIFNIAGDLDVKEGAQLVLGDVRPENVFWNVEGQVSIDKNTTFTGIVMAADGIDYQVPSGLELALLTQGTITFTAADTESTGYASSFYSHDVLSNRIFHHCAAPVSVGTGYNFGSVQGNVPLLSTKFTSFGTDAAGQPYTEAILEIELTSANNPVYTVEKTINVLGYNPDVDFTAEFIAKYGFEIPCGSFLLRTRYYNACTIVHSAFTGSSVKINVNCFSVSLPDASACTSTPVSVTATINKHPDLYGPNVYLDTSVPYPINWYLNNQPLLPQPGNGMTVTVPANLLTLPGQYTLKTEMTLYRGGTNSHTETQTSVITVAAPPQVNVSTVASQLCSPGSVTATILNGEAGHTYNVQVSYGNVSAAPFQVTGLSGATPVPLPYTSVGAYTLTVYDAAVPGCPTTVNFTIGGIKTLGVFGQVTTIDASQAPYTGTVNFSGEYRVLGPVEFINGTFNLQPGTTFYFDPEGGALLNNITRFMRGTRNSLKVTNATLSLSGATLTVNTCWSTHEWGGIVLSDNARFISNRGGSPLKNSEISKSFAGIWSEQVTNASNPVPVADVYYPNTNFFDINYTDFLNNELGLVNVHKTASQPGEGIRNSNFSNSWNGIHFGWYGGDYANAAFSGNTFTNCTGYALYGTTHNITIAGNQFTDNEVAIGLFPELNNTTAHITVTGNTFTIPAGKTGIEGGGRLTVTGNTMTGSVASGYAAGAIGIQLYAKDNEVSGSNTFSKLDIAVDMLGRNTEVRGNTFTDNLHGVAFRAQSQAGPSYAYGAGSNLVKCNTFSAPNVPGSKGIYIGPGMRLTATGNPNALGADGILDPGLLPNGNLFVNITNPVYNDLSNDPLVYWIYSGSSQDLTSSSPGLVGVNIQTGTPVGRTACTTPNLGVNTRLGRAGIAVNGTPSDEALGRSYPNPTAAEAAIPYQLPAGCRSAFIVIRDIVTGRELKTVALAAGKPESLLTVDLSRLPNGMYTYSLQADGRTLATRKLTVVK